MSALGIALIGWCGTKYPGWWRNPPSPDPEPWWRDSLFGLIGAGAAVVVNNALGGSLADMGFGAIATVSFFAGAVSRDVVGGALRAVNR
jgi:hypothetical protein